MDGTFCPDYPGRLKHVLRNSLLSMSARNYLLQRETYASLKFPCVSINLSKKGVNEMIYLQRFQVKSRVPYNVIEK